MFYYILIIIFKKILEIWSFMSGNFFENFSRISEKISEIFSTFSKSKKTIIFVTKLVRNEYIDQNLVKFSHETPKNGQFSLKTLNFSQFSAPSAPKFGVLCPKKADFLELVPPSPLSEGHPLIHLWLKSFLTKCHLCRR